MDSPKQPKEICTITIVFPVDSDDKALECKKKIAEIIAFIPEARFDFRLMTIGKPVV